MKIAVCGLGKAGTVLARRIILDGQDQLIMAVCRDQSKSAGMDIGDMLYMPKTGSPVIKLGEFAKVEGADRPDVVIDFSKKETSLELAQVCMNKGINLIVCTTNFDDDEVTQLYELSQKGAAGMVYAPNLTLGVNLLMEFVARLSKILPDFDFEIIERHSKSKPKVTTTAKLISRAIDRGKTPISSIRVGGYVGVHEVTAASADERITIVHESFTRNAFATGALLAAKFIGGRKGFYEMKDVIADLEKRLM